MKTVHTFTIKEAEKFIRNRLSKKYNQIVEIECEDTNGFFMGVVAGASVTFVIYFLTTVL